RFDNPRAVQIRLPGFTMESLVALGITIRDLFADGSEHPERIRVMVDDDYLADLARAVGGTLGGKVGVAPRLFLKKPVGDVLDRCVHRQRTVASAELTDTERNAVRADDIDLDL